MWKSYGKWRHTTEINKIKKALRKRKIINIFKLFKQKIV